MQDWNFSEYSQETAKDIACFLPDNIFDAHAHPGDKAMCDTERISILKELPEDIGYRCLERVHLIDNGQRETQRRIVFRTTAV